MITRLSFFGGAEVQLVHLARGLARMGYEVTLCSLEPTPADPGKLADQGIELVSLGATNRYRRLAVLPRLTRLARRADVVHCTMWDASLWGRLAAIAARRPVIVADHAARRSAQVSAKGAPRAKWIALHNRLLDRFTYATVACATCQRPVLEAEGVDPDKTVYIPNGIPVDELLEAAENGPSRRELGIPEQGSVALQVGVFRPEKNQIGSVEAFERVRERVEGAQLAFAGEGETRASVEERAQASGEGIHFLGPRRDVPGLLALADLMLLPSTADAMPMTVLEAMALGVPVIASDVGDTREALTDEAGISVPAGDLEALTDAWLRVLTDDELRARLGAAGARRARQFDASVMARRYSALFEAACSGDAPQAAVSAVD
ncbi:MAG TPA: glycosyltransferase [Solirubrobacterales bacterium]|nr:glycosyltransferase [Solirubrobacterales bacterium]